MNIQQSKKIPQKLSEYCIRTAKRTIRAESGSLPLQQIFISIFVGAS